MTAHHLRRTMLAMTLVAAALLMTAAPASAIYRYSPLHLSASASEAKVGDVIGITITQNSDSEGSWAGREILLRYGHPRSEPVIGQTYEEELPQDDEPVEDSSWVDGELGRIQLDSTGGATYQWTVPADVDDHNVIIGTYDENGESLGTVHIRVGDAAPMMMAMSESKGGGSLMDEESTTPPDTTVQEDAVSDSPAASAPKDVPAPGVLAAIGLTAAIAIALRRRLA